MMLSASAHTPHPKEVAQFIDFMVHDPEVGRIMGYDRGILASTEQYAAYKPTDEVNKEIAHAPPVAVRRRRLRLGQLRALARPVALVRVPQEHLGKWAGLGTRHGVQHFGDSAKQQRIANTTYRRFYYFLTADERVGDLMHANVDSDETFLVLDPQRKVRTDPYTPDRHALSIGFGTDWSGLVSAWLTEWERMGPKWEKARARVLSTMEGIAAQPNGFVQGGGLYDLDTGTFAVAGKPGVSVSHLSAVFGLNELCAELIHLVDMPAFQTAYLDHCRYFNATKAEQKARYGSDFGTLLLFQGHSRLDAYAAVQTGDATLAGRAWTKFYGSDGYTESSPWKTEKLTGPVTLVEGSEASWVSSNVTALYGLAAIENLALLGDRMP